MAFSTLAVETRLIVFTFQRLPINDNPNLLDYRTNFLCGISPNLSLCTKVCEIQICFCPLAWCFNETLFHYFERLSRLWDWDANIDRSTVIFDLRSWTSSEVRAICIYQCFCLLLLPDQRHDWLVHWFDYEPEHAHLMHWSDIELTSSHRASWYKNARICCRLRVGECKFA